MPQLTAGEHWWCHRDPTHQSGMRLAGWGQASYHCPQLPTSGVKANIMLTFVKDLNSRRDFARCMVSSIIILKKIGLLEHSILKLNLLDDFVVQKVFQKTQTCSATPKSSLNPT